MRKRQVDFLNIAFYVFNIFDFLENYFDNFLLKVNAKLGGTNEVFDPNFLAEVPLNMNRTMIVGVVNHPFENDTFTCSMTVANGSFDNLFSKYSSTVRVQRKEPENIVIGIDSMIRELLTEYQSNNDGNLPENIIIFRDGVTRVQFETLFATELESVVKLLNKKKDEIKLTVIVTQKHRAPLPSKPGTRVQFPMTIVNDPNVKDTDMDMFDLKDYFKLKVCKVIVN